MALALAILAIHLSSNGGNLSPQTWMFWVAIGCGIFGLVVLILTIGLVVYLVPRHEDTTTQDIKDIKSNTEKIGDINDSIIKMNRDMTHEIRQLRKAVSNGNKPK